MAAISRDFGRPGRIFDARRVARRWCAAAVALLVVFTSQSALAGTLVQMNYANFGSVQIDLFDDLSPISVNNFVTRYVATGRYTDTMIHRVDVGLGVIQGGGFTKDAAAVATAADPMIALEYSRANTRGTISMARTAALNSATSQWFINTDDNTTSLGQSNGGGYAVFGWIVGPGMGVVDAIAAVPTFVYGSPFNQLPLQNFTLADYNNSVDPLPHVVVLSSVTIVKTHPSFQNPFLATDVNNDGSLKASDVAAVNFDLLKNGFHDLTGPFSGTSYLDVDGDGRVNLSDSLKTINALLKAPAPQVSPLMESSASPLLVVPEPGSLTLGGLAALALVGYAARVRRQRRRAVRN
jgi:peptidyl-prolyl cis-trans isomerase A (cyclophilin A)